MATESIKVGQDAPAFSLPDQYGRMASLTDYKGEWVALYFYPKDDTPGCTTEACEFSSELKQFENAGAVILGVSPDTADSHMQFAGKHDLKLRLLSDPMHTVLETYGAWGDKTIQGKKTQGVIRSTVLIDPQGRVAFHWPDVKPEGHASEVRQKIVELKSKSMAA